MTYHFYRSPEKTECYDICDENDVLIDCVAYKENAEISVNILNTTGLSFYKLYNQLLLVHNQQRIYHFFPNHQMVQKNKMLGLVIGLVV